MPQTPEIEKIKNYVTDVDLNKLNNIEIIKVILDSLVQNCNELLQLKSDTLSDVLGAYPKSPLLETTADSNCPSPLLINNKNTNNDTNNNDTNNNDDANIDNSEEKTKEENNDDSNEQEKAIEIEETKNDNEKSDSEENSNKNNKSPGSPVIKSSDMDGLENPQKQKTPKELIKELEYLIILIHSLYDNKPKNDKNEKSTVIDVLKSSRNEMNMRSDSLASVLTSNTELNSVINAIDTLLKSSPRFNNQCVHINAEGKKKFQLMGVLSVVDRMTRTRLNDQRASPNQLNRVNRLIDLLNKSLVRQ